MPGAVPVVVYTYIQQWTWHHLAVLIWCKISYASIWREKKDRELVIAKV